MAVMPRHARQKHKGTATRKGFVDAYWLQPRGLKAATPLYDELSSRLRTNGKFGEAAANKCNKVEQSR